MKKVCLAVVLLFLILPVCVRAKESTASGVMSEFSSLEDVLPEDIASLLPEGFFDEDPTVSSSGVRQASRFGYFMGMVANIIGLHLTDALALFASLLGMIILGALAERIRLLFRTDMLRTAFMLVLSCALLCAVLSLQYRFLSDVFTFFERLTALVNGMIPLTGALYAMGGNVTTAVVSHAGMMMFLSLVENFCTVALRAAVGICTALTVCTAVMPSVSFTGMINLVKRVYTFSLGFVMMLLSFSLSVQTTLSAASDSVAMRGAKMLAGTAIPVVGGSVGETLKTVSGSIKFLKSTVGVGGMVIVGLLLLPTLVSVLVYRLVFITASACADFLGCSREAKLLSGFVTVYGYLLASVAICSVTFIFLLTLFVRCSVAV